MNSKDEQNLSDKDFLRLLERRTKEISREPLNDMLHKISYERGLSWELTGQLLGVTSAAIKKWRREDSIPLESGHDLATLIAFCESLGRVISTDAGLWFESSVTKESNITFADLYAEGLVLELLDIASGRAEATQVLDKEMPRWREAFPCDQGHIVVEASDGQRSIIPR